MLPNVFQTLLHMNCLSSQDLRQTECGFHTAVRSLAEILAKKNILTFPNDRGQECRCDRFFDDWYLYSIRDEVCSLFKMREQESDASELIPADGDTPGATVSFIAFDCSILLDCLRDPSAQNRQRLNREINRVVAIRGQAHHPELKAYFQDPRSEGAYLIGELYVYRLAALSQEGRLPVPEAYAQLHRRYLAEASQKDARLPRFLEENNRLAGKTVCDHRYVYIQNPTCLSRPEKLALLATHTANTSFQSFAAEVCYHARFLTSLARIPIPFIGRSVYDSAIRADMTVDDTELEGPAPYYDPDSSWIRQQMHWHPER